MIPKSGNRFSEKIMLKAALLAATAPRAIPRPEPAFKTVAKDG
jgi:hypothetical protein